MSVEEETELRDLVAQTLDLSGCLSKIRAELRANLFLALDEDQSLSAATPLLNPKIAAAMATSEGRLMFGIVRDFLEYYSLDYTLSVFEPESYLDRRFQCPEREQIAADLGLRPPTAPILTELVRLAQNKTKTLQIDLAQLNGHAPSQNGCSESEASRRATENDDTFNGTSSIEEEMEDKSSNESKSARKGEKRPKDKQKMNDILPSLYNKDFLEKSSKEADDFDIKDDYEEDFMSGSEVEFSLSKVDCPKPLLEELAEYQKSQKLISKQVNGKIIDENDSSPINTDQDYDKTPTGHSISQ